MNVRASKILSIGLASAASALLACALLVFVRHYDFWRYNVDVGLNPVDAVRVFGWPSGKTEWFMALNNAAYDEDWDRLDRLTSKDRHSEIGSCYRNLAKAMKGELLNSLLDYYAPFERALFVPVNEQSGRFGAALSGEVWYQLGEMTMAEHSAILGLIFSRKQNGRRFLRRLGEINQIWGDDRAALKYFTLAGNASRLSSAALARMRSYLPSEDIVHSSTAYRSTLRELVKTNPGNLRAYEYLICLDLLVKNLDAFADDFNPVMPSARICQEAALIWMASTGDHSSRTAAHFGIEEKVFGEFCKFSSMVDSSGMEEIQERFGTSYWFYFKYATRNDKS